ncbi:hypothetical protein NY10_1742 [Carnobacterium antarcticum]|nr:hypothetical protein NY10_1742 [Carnobacterium sp. CP1]
MRTLRKEIALYSKKNNSRTTKETFSFGSTSTDVGKEF